MNFVCKRYNPTELDKQKEKMRLNAKYEIERYANYYNSYNEEQKAYNFALKLNEKVEKYKNALEKEKNQPHLELKFLDEAIQSVIDCHRILKNTYIFGYYMKEDKNNQLYNYHQEMLRREADLLHELLEMQELPTILSIVNLEEFNKEFANYKGRVLSLMSATSKFIENILVDIENHPDNIDYNLLKNISNNTVNSKKK